MSRVYDNWERLVVAVLKREELRRIALCESFSSSISADFSSRFSFDSSLEDVPAASRIYAETFDPTANSSHHGVQEIKFEEIEKATKYFSLSMYLGEGRFYRVFKGWIDEDTLSTSKRGSGMAVAVKEGWLFLQGHQERLNYLSQLRHPNLVKLIGYCFEKNRLYLVHEFMPKGSLDNHLFRATPPQSLSWETRIKVAIGAARGLSFLHDLATLVKHGGCQISIPFLRDSVTKVMHRGCHSRNILLDEGFNAKLDFGFAGDDPTAEMMTHISTEIEGPYGTVKPEYGPFTTECDVYGFGIVLLELLSGRRKFDRTRPWGERDLVQWAKPYLGKNRRLLPIMDSKLEGQYSHKGAYTVAILALQCISSDPKQRPRMAEVLVALEQLQ